jgi:hypothetical protein
MKTVSILRFLTAIGAALTTLASLDLAGIAPLFEHGVAIYLVVAGPAALCLKELVVALGDWLDDGKPNKSFRIGLFGLAIAFLGLPLLVSCASAPSVSGTVESPGRRVEILIQPHTSK